jgi:hypothetical protein
MDLLTLQTPAGHLLFDTRSSNPKHERKTPLKQTPELTLTGGIVAIMSLP